MVFVERDKDVMTVKSFPLVPILFCIAVFLGVVYGWFSGDLDGVGFFIAFFNVFIFVSLMDVSFLVLRRKAGKASLTSRKLFSRRYIEFPFTADCFARSARARGAVSKMGIVEFCSSEGVFSVTSMASMGAKKRAKIVHQINAFISSF